MSSGCGCQEQEQEIVQYIEEPAASSCGCEDQQSRIEFVEEPEQCGCEQEIEYQLIEEPEPEVQYYQVVEQPQQVYLVDSSSIVQIYQSPVTAEPMREIKSASYCAPSPAPAPLKLIPDTKSVQIYQSVVTAGPITEVASGVIAREAPKYTSKPRSVLYYQSTTQAEPIQEVRATRSLRRAALPAVNASCYSSPPVEPGVTTYRKVKLPTEYRLAETNDETNETIVRENNNYTEFNKKVVTTVNRNHLHKQRVVTNENNYNTYITNKVTKVNDIHRQRVEQVQGERREINDYKQSQVVEPARCLRAADESSDSYRPCDEQ